MSAPTDIATPVKTGVDELGRGKFCPRNGLVSCSAIDPIISGAELKTPSPLAKTLAK